MLNGTDFHILTACNWRLLLSLRFESAYGELFKISVLTHIRSSASIVSYHERSYWLKQDVCGSLSKHLASQGGRMDDWCTVYCLLLPRRTLAFHPLEKLLAEKEWTAVIYCNSVTFLRILICCKQISIVNRNTLLEAIPFVVNKFIRRL